MLLPSGNIGATQMSSTQEKLEQPFLERILYIGNEIPESLVEDKRDKFILLGTPQDLVSEVQALIDSAKREELGKLHETLLVNEDNPDPVKLIEYRLAQLE